jgi:hypothetical protein
MTSTPAARVLAAVLEGIPAPTEDNGNFRVVDSWTEGDDFICVVYRGWWHESILGLRRRIEADVPLDDMIGKILDAELGEPPGALVEDVEPDSDGITWWQGEPRQWWRDRPETSAHAAVSALVRLRDGAHHGKGWLGSHMCAPCGVER